MRRAHSAWIVRHAGMMGLVAAAILAVSSSAAATASWGPAHFLSSSTPVAASGAVFAGTGAKSGVVLYGDTNPNTSDWGVFARRTSDGGVSWTSRQLISGSAEAGYASIAASGKDVYAVWLEGRLRYRRSIDGGVTWQPPKTLAPFHKMLEVGLTANGHGDVAVSWAEWDTGKVQVRVSHDHGQTFAPAIRIGSTSAESKTDAAYGSGVLYVAYWASDNAIRLRRSTDGGATWKPSVQLATNGQGSQDVSVAAHGTNAVVVFGGSDMRERSTGNRGATWSSTGTLGANASNGLAVTFAAGAFRTVYATYVPCCQKLAYRQSVDGVTWSSPSLVASAATATPTDVTSMATHTVVFYLSGADYRAAVKRSR